MVTIPLTSLTTITNNLKKSMFSRSKHSVIVSGPGGGVKIFSENLGQIREDIASRVGSLRAQVSESGIQDLAVLPPPTEEEKKEIRLKELLGMKELTFEER